MHDESADDRSHGDAPSRGDRGADGSVAVGSRGAAANDAQAAQAGQALPAAQAGQAVSATKDATAAPPSGGVGKVYLVGAGPGAVDLITVRGQRLLEAADVVVHDALVEPALYRGLRAELVDVGKRAGVHALPQDEISALLVRLAQQGKKVVRLKGGDPFVLGRGSEEALALASAGVPHEVVPGVSSAIAAPLLAGIPVTHRGVADAFCVVSAHPRDADAAFTLPAYRARLTVVLLMGVGSVAAWSAALLRNGWPEQTPVAWVMWAGRDEQRRIDGTLGDAVDAAERGELKAPAVAIVGDVAALRAGVSPAPPALSRGRPSS